MKYYVGTIIFLIQFLEVILSERECYSRDYGRGSIVCVCTSDFCDTLPEIRKPSSDRYVSYTTSKSGQRFEKDSGSFTTKSARINTKLTVDAGLGYQYMQGWGGSFTESNGYNINSLESRTRDKLLRSIFSKDGLEFNLCRVPIGNDFSSREYSNDDSEEETSAESFRLSSNEKDDKISVIKKAIRMSNEDLYLLASSWSGPHWSDYYIKFLDEYKDEGLNFWGLTVGGEKWFNYRSSERSSNAAQWIQNHLSSTLKNSDHSSVNLLATLDSKKRSDVAWASQYLYSNGNSRERVEGTTFRRCNLKSTYGRYLNEAHSRNPEKLLLTTQICDESNRNDRERSILGDWSRAENYASSIIQDVRNYAVGWIGDSIAGVTRGSTVYTNIIDSPIIVNGSSDEFYKQPLYYVMGHFSKFVPRESVRISSTQSRKSDDRTVVVLNGDELEDDENRGYYYISPVYYGAVSPRRKTDYDSGYFSFYSPKSSNKNSLLETVAFRRPDDAIVVIMLNKNGHDVNVEIKDKDKGSMDKNVPSRSIVTVLYS